MKISLNWLSRYVKLNHTPSELAHALTMAGLEVEEIESIGLIPEGVIVAKILSRKKHENSDHLSICEVDTGSEVLQIVCGAPNCDAGNIVPLATIGTVFKDAEGEFKIKKSKIRGVESNGMLCSERELGLSGNHDGLMILPAAYELGKPFSDYVSSDTVYTLEVTSNRPDWLSHWGVARDISALLKTELNVLDLSGVEKNIEKCDIVKLEAPELCPHYTARVIKGVKVAPSPEWMQNALNSVGIRPINNIVDITNYVMMELGEPLHAFDRRHLKEGRIVVRRADDKEKITALDGKEYELTNDMLVIADAEKPVAIAGVMGGEYSGVSDDTTELVLESACFAPASVRATSRKLGLTSDSSYRFERGVDPGMVISAGERALQLILEIAGGEYIGFCDAGAPEIKARKIKMNFDKLRSLLAMDLSKEIIVEILEKLGFEASEITMEDAIFGVPSWRETDVAGLADLAEEVARIYGLDKLPDVPIKATQSDFSMDSCSVIQTLRDQLIGIGLYDCVCPSMIDEKSAVLDGVFSSDDLIKVINPISLDLAVMRPSLLPGMLSVVKHNIARRNNDLALFEIGCAFCANHEKFPDERDELVIAMTGRRHPERYSAERSELLDFYDLKGVIESLFEVRRMDNFTFSAIDDPRFIKGICAEILLDGKRVGVFGEVVPALTKSMRIQTPLYCAVMQVAGLLEAKEKSVYYVSLSQFPATTRDVAFLAPMELESRTVIEFIRNAKLPNFEDVELFDIFKDKSLGDDKKSMAYTLVFRSSERTLTDEEVNVAHEDLRAKLAKGLGVELR